MTKTQKTHTKKSFLLAATLLLSSMGATQVTAFTVSDVTNEITAPRAVLAVLLATFARLATKGANDDNITLQNFTEKLNEQKTIKSKIAFAAQAIDDLLIGYKGKKTGPELEGKNLVVHCDKKIDAYGLCAYVLNTVKSVSKELEGMKDIIATVALLYGAYNAADIYAMINSFADKPKSAAPAPAAPAPVVPAPAVPAPAVPAPAAA